MFYPVAVGKQDIVRDGLILWLDANDKSSYPGSGTTWNDLTSGDNNGTLTNGPTFSSNDGGSIVFDGVDDYVNLGTPSVIEQINGLTISTWIYIDVFSSDADAFASTDGTTRGWYLGTWNHPNTGNLDIIRWLVSTDGSTTDALNTSELNTGQWYYIVSTWDANNMRIYVDGILDNSINTSNTNPPLPSSPNSLRVGERYSLNRFFNGNIANTQIYNRALTAEEVLQNYNATKDRFGL